MKKNGALVGAALKGRNGMRMNLKMIVQGIQIVKISKIIDVLQYIQAGCLQRSDHLFGVRKLGPEQCNGGFQFRYFPVFKG
jgi:hypothetical protein